ncbi:MAG TPA: hypothetical protein VIY86_06240, partial [Pirellulaceae bacterium]
MRDVHAPSMCPGTLLRWRRGAIFAVTMLAFEGLAVAQTSPPSPAATAPRRGPVRQITDRQTADQLLKRARMAIASGNLELADWYVDAAEKLHVNYDSILHRFSDTPSKIRAEIQKLRQSRPAPPATSNAPPPVVASSGTSASPQGRKPDTRTPAQPPTLDPPSTLTEPAPLIDADQFPSRSSVETPRQVARDPLPPTNRRRPHSPTLIDPADPRRMAVRGSDKSLPPHPNQSVVVGDVRTSELIQRGTSLRGNGPPTRAGSDLHATWQAKKEKCVAWLAESQAALDRGDLPLADRFARAAQQLQVPDEAYDLGEPRPWMLLMEVHKQLRRSGASPEIVNNAPLFEPPPLASPTQAPHPSGYDPMSIGSPTGAVVSQAPLYNAPSSVAAPYTPGSLFAQPPTGFAQTPTNQPLAPAYADPSANGTNPYLASTPTSAPVPPLPLDG